MTSIIATATSASTGNGPTATATLNNISGTDVAIVTISSARTFNTAFTLDSVTWDATTMTTVIEQIANLNGFPRGLVRISILPIGNPSGLTANAVMTLSVSNASREITVYAVEGVDQTTPTIDTDSSSFTSSASSTSDVVTSSDDDIVFGGLTLAAEQTVTSTSGLIKDANVTKFEPASFTHVAGHKSPSDATSTTVSWSWSSSSFVHVAASFLNSGFVPGATPVISSTISSKGTDGIIPVTDTNITINGTGFQGTVSTKVFYSSSSTFGVGIQVEQPIDSITSTSVNWLEPQLGDIGRGNQFIFVRTNEGEIDEETSVAFAVQVEAFVSTGIPTLTRFIHVCNGVSSTQTIIDNLGYTPKACVISAIATTNLDSVDADAPSSICFVATNGTMGDGIASKSAGGTVLRRIAISGTGSLIVMSSASTSAADLVRGTPSFLSEGLQIIFTANTSGVRLQITIIGGDSIESSIDEIQISDGSLTGLSFEPELLIGTTVGLTQGSDSDNIFALRSWGLANATDQCLLGFNNGVTRNCVAKSASFLGQVVDTSFTWEMAITALTSDGFTWSGTDGDKAYVMSLNLSGRATFIGQFTTSASGTPGLSEQLPDVGFDPAIILMTSAIRTADTLTTALGGRYSWGTCTPELDNRVVSTKFLPATGAGTAEQFQSEDLILAGSGSAGANELEGRITVFGQISTILYPVKPAAALITHIIAIESGVDESIAVDADGGHIATLTQGQES